MKRAPAALKEVYHRLIPPAIRYPIGRFRRDVEDRVRRLVTRGPLPPRDLLQRVQITPYVREYLEVGGRGAATVREAIRTADLAHGGPLRVLDFGCGLGRTLRFMAGEPWQLYGCDVDAYSIEWARQAYRFATLDLTGDRPPLPYADGSFDALYGISVFTHFAEADQTTWARELARVLKPGGLAVISTMGPMALGSFPNLATPGNTAALEEMGFVVAIEGERFNERGTFHCAAGVERFFSEGFELRSWTQGGLDDFQDLSCLVKT